MFLVTHVLEYPINAHANAHVHARAHTQRGFYVVHAGVIKQCYQDHLKLMQFVMLRNNYLLCEQKCTYFKLKFICR
jgi:uncharacterized RmlC-like cupin family protein